MNLRDFLRLYTAAALLGGLAFWPAACASNSTPAFANVARPVHQAHASATLGQPGNEAPVPAQGKGVEQFLQADFAARSVRSSVPFNREIPSGLGEAGLVSAQGEGDAYEVTAYSHGCVMPRSGVEGPAQRAANGRWPIADVTVAADTSLHPFGTEVLVEGLGFRTVGDRGHAIKGRKLDLFVDSCREARAFGRRFLRVVPVPADTTRLAAR